MNQELLIFLPNQSNGAIQWLRRDSQSNTVQSGTLPNADALPSIQELAQGTLCRVIAPLSAVTVLYTRFPKNSKEAMSAVAFQLEDQLCEDIEALHFVIGAKEASGKYPVAVVRKPQLSDWLALLKAAGITPEQLIPEAINRPDDEVLCGLLLDGHILISDAEGKQFSVPTAQLGTWWAHAHKTYNKPLIIHLNDQEQRHFESPPASGDSTTNWQTRDIQSLIGFMHFNPSLNLLQGAYKPKRPGAQSPDIWLPPTVALLLLFVLAPAAMFWQNMQLETKKAEFRRQSEQLYRDTFPDSQRIVNLRAQTEHRLNSLRIKSQGSPFLLQLNELSRLLKPLGQLEFDSMTYDDSLLTGEFTITSGQPIAQIRNQLEQVRKNNPRLSYSINANARITAELKR